MIDLTPVVLTRRETEPMPVIRTPIGLRQRLQAQAVATTSTGQRRGPGAG